ncbi:Bug family tripartite tricarboxylate transporter substrate binding protein [Falsiroseomonas oryziterrae]|uniref:Bug family tripartite tricarboxylate transporter substrate binding protein n=1 Tax=Falsiroseomonas oryziterrae TaxID=2911368 RepID=UPI001F3DD9B2|nr:tripartite tricarboxylate transporter substrate binding protein [Roseomonas sp. NPKOSM-4]
MHRTITRRTLGGLALAPLALPARAQANWPERPIRWIIPFPPAGTADILSRLLAERVGPRLGQPVVAENRAGAGGTLAADLVARARGDLHMVMMSNFAPHGTSPTLFPNVAYDAVADFTHLGLFGALPMVIAVNPSHPARTLEEFLTAARARAGTVGVAYGGNGTASHLIGVQFQKVARVEFTFVPYRGAGPALTDVLAGVLPGIIETLPAAIGHIRAGRLRPLAVSGAARSPALPDVPHFGELGLTAAQGVNWFGFCAPAGLPQPVAARWVAEISTILDSAEMRDRMGQMGFEGTRMEPAFMTAFVGEEVARWRTVIRENNVSAD